MNFNHVLICCLFSDCSYLLRSNEMTLRQAFMTLWRYLWGLELEGTAWENGLCPATRVTHRAAPLPLPPSLPRLCVWLRFSFKISSGREEFDGQVSLCPVLESVRSPGWTFRAWICSFLLRISHRIDAELRSQFCL